MDFPGIPSSWDMFSRYPTPKLCIQDTTIRSGGIPSRMARFVWKAGPLNSSMEILSVFLKHGELFRINLGTYPGSLPTSSCHTLWVGDWNPSKAVYRCLIVHTPSQKALEKLGYLSVAKIPQRDMLTLVSFVLCKVYLYPKHSMCGLYLPTKLCVLGG